MLEVWCLLGGDRIFLHKTYLHSIDNYQRETPMKSGKTTFGLLCILLIPLLASVSFVPRAECSGAPATLWSKTYGGTSDDEVYSLIRSDGGYVMAGGTYSFGAGGGDAYVVKTEGSGNLQWNKTYGEAVWDEAECIIDTADGGYAIAGVTASYGSGGLNPWDFWMVKTDSSGNHQWNKTYGRSGVNEVAFCVIQTSDNGYVLVGGTNPPYWDFWVVKTDLTGNMQWNKTFGSAGEDIATSVLQTVDGGYLVAGSGFANLVRLDASGNGLWNKTYGGHANNMISASDGGYILSGGSGSLGSGTSDFWAVEVDSSGSVLWNKTYGGVDDDFAYSITETYDGGYALAGYTESFGLPSKYWLVKINSLGNMQWNKTWNGASFGSGTVSVKQASDGGYVLALGIDDFGAGGVDFWLVKTGYALDITINEGGSTSPTMGTHPYTANATVQVTAVPNEHYLFDHWELDGVSVGSTNPFSVFMDDNHTLHAVFVTHNVAILDVVPLKTIVGQGFNFNITVIVANRGNVAESFDVTTHANSSALDTKSVQSLLAHANTTLSFTGNTTAFQKGYYVVKAVSSDVPNEMNASDNTLVDGIIYVGVPGDIDGNHIVNMLDLYFIALNFGKSAPFATPQIANYDIDNNGIINMLDLYIAATHFGQTDP